jgi:tryptophan synthase alpha chain
MSSDRYAVTFARERRVFVPFLMLGDPDAATSEALIEAAIAGGADALELGIPFSDPIADGPVIQDAAVRARAAGTTPASAFALVAAVRARHPALPIGLLVYANLVVARGRDAFYGRARDAGVDSVLVADVPLGEAEPFVAAARRHEVAPIFVAPPDASDATAHRIAELGAGYTYVLGRAGVTGEGSEPIPPSPELIAALRRHRAPPALVGFGVARPDHVERAIAAGAAGAISGSALVARIARAPDRAAKLRATEEFVRAMKGAERASPRGA